MLVLTRRVGESLYVYAEGKKIVFKVLSKEGLQVKIGIEADKEVQIARDESWLKLSD